MFNKKPLLRNALSESYIRQCQSVFISDKAQLERSRFDMMVKQKGASDSCLKTSPQSSINNSLQSKDSSSRTRNDKNPLRASDQKPPRSSSKTRRTSKPSTSTKISKESVRTQKLEEGLDQEYLALIVNQAETIHLRMKIVEAMIKFEEASTFLRRKSEQISQSSVLAMHDRTVEKSFSAPLHHGLAGKGCMLLPSFPISPSAHTA